jgi:hypothetical protein
LSFSLEHDEPFDSQPVVKLKLGGIVRQCYFDALGYEDPQAISECPNNKSLLPNISFLLVPATLER